MSPEQEAYARAVEETANDIVSIFMNIDGVAEAIIKANTLTKGDQIDVAYKIIWPEIATYIVQACPHTKGE